MYLCLRRAAGSTISAVLLALTVLGASVSQVQTELKRPKITGISHVGFFTSDLPETLAFWHDLLGYDQAYTLAKPGTTETRIAFVKINDQQHIELFNEPPTHPNNMLSHLCFRVDDLAQMRLFLRSKGYDVKPENGGKTRTGDYAFEIKDPNGTLIEFVQSLPTGQEMQAAGRFLPAERVSRGIYHVGYMVSDAQKTIDFYHMLGFTETWRGGADPKQLSWVNMRVPDGTDYVELMLYSKPPDAARMGTMNHISLVVPDIAQSVADLEKRAYFSTYGRPLKINTGVNGKRQVNLYDPDGTRVELMEPVTVDGKPRPSSTAPYPVAEPAR